MKGKLINKKNSFTESKEVTYIRTDRKNLSCDSYLNIIYLFEIVEETTTSEIDLNKEKFSV